jgi:hypothetical protein
MNYGKVFLKTLVVVFSLFVIHNSLFIIPSAQALEPYQLSVPIPVPGAQPITQITNPAEYIQTIYRFGLGIGALLAVAVIVFAAIQYTVSAGNVAKQSDAKDRILNAVWGLALLLAAVLILNTIDPRLAQLRLEKPGAVSLEPAPPETGFVDTYMGSVERQTMRSAHQQYNQSPTLQNELNLVRSQLAARQRLLEDMTRNFQRGAYGQGATWQQAASHYEQLQRDIRNDEARIQELERQLIQAQ